MGRIMQCNQVAKADASVVGYFLRTKGLATGPFAPSQYVVRFSTETWSGSRGNNNELQSSC